MKCKMCPRRKVCRDECYGENPCDFAVKFEHIGHTIDRKDICIEALKEQLDAAIADIRPHFTKCKHREGCTFISAVTGLPDCTACDRWEWRGLVAKKEEDHE